MNIDIKKNLCGMIEQLPVCDVIIFVPKGCYRYITSFLRKEVVQKTMLWEIHIDPHQTKTDKVFVQELKNKACLIIDKTYSGKTLNCLANLVKKEGGIPFRLGLFPKSRQAIKDCEYVLLLDRIFKVDDLDLEKDNWPERYYKKILSLS